MFDMIIYIFNKSTERNWASITASFSVPLFAPKILGGRDRECSDVLINQSAVKWNGLGCKAYRHADKASVEKVTSKVNSTVCPSRQCVRGELWSAISKRGCEPASGSVLAHNSISGQTSK